MDRYSLSDQKLVEGLGKFIKHHRMQKNLTQQTVADRCGISRSTLSLLERGEGVTLTTFVQVLRSLELLHVLDAFEMIEVVSPLQVAKQDQAKRQRVSREKNPKDGSEW